MVALPNGTLAVFRGETAPNILHLPRLWLRPWPQPSSFSRTAPAQRRGSSLTFPGPSPSPSPTPASFSSLTFTCSAPLSYFLLLSHLPLLPSFPSPPPPTPSPAPSLFLRFPPSLASVPLTPHGTLPSPEPAPRPDPSRGRLSRIPGAGRRCPPAVPGAGRAVPDAPHAFSPQVTITGC